MAETAKPPPTLYYIRHGETDWNVAGRLQGRHDVPLNARGRAQAAHCGGVLRDLFARDCWAGASHLAQESLCWCYSFWGLAQSAYF